MRKDPFQGRFVFVYGLLGGHFVSPALGRPRQIVHGSDFRIQRQKMGKIGLVTTDEALFRTLPLKV